MKEQDVSLNIRLPPRKWTKDDGILEAFALMDCDDLHGFFIAFKPNLIFIGSQGLGISLLYKPPQERHRPQPLSNRFVFEKFCQMKNIRQATLTVRILKKTLFQMFSSHELPEHLDETLSMPRFMII